MAEVLVRFGTPILDADGHAYTARICGRQAEDGWEGWIELVPGDGRAVLRTARETIQSDRSDLLYWATGLTSTYLEGALERALHPEPHQLGPRQVASVPAFDRPARSSEEIGAMARPPYPRAVLDPFSVYAQGEDVLRQQLGALGTDHLRTIVQAHALVGNDEVDLYHMQHATLVDLIIAAVHKRMR